MYSNDEDYLSVIYTHKSLTMHKIFFSNRLKTTFIRMGKIGSLPFQDAVSDLSTQKEDIFRDG